MTWFKVDDKLHDHRKLRRLARTEIGRAAVGVWTLAGSWCADNLTDGFVPATVLDRWGTTAHADQLVDAGLWLPEYRDGEDGWLFHDWLEFQPTRAKVEASRRAGAQRVAAWRDKHRTPEPTFATPPGDGWTPEDLARIQQVTGGSNTHARKCADLVLARAPGQVRNRVAYVLRAIEANPTAFRYRRGNPTKTDECPQHAGEWADACRGCAIDAKVGDQ